MDLAGAIALGEGLELKLGREVTLRLRPSTEIEGAVEIDLAGARYVAPLGPARLPVPGWQIGYHLCEECAGFCALDDGLGAL